MAIDPSQLVQFATTGLDAFGEYTQRKNLSKALDLNADIMAASGPAITQAGELQARRIEERGARLIARQSSDYAKAGVRFEGSPALVMAQTAKALREDIILTRLSAVSKRNELEFKALQKRIEAGQQRTRALQQASNKFLNLTGKLSASAALSDAPGTVGNTGKTQSQILGYDTRQFR